ncbi:MAG: hypothetical protein ACLQVY_23535 [Limisphaerales bacterium]
MTVGFRTWAFGLVLVLAVGSTAIPLFYAEELWRGKWAWEDCRRSLELRGIPLDWARYTPAPVADDENALAVPEMQQWFGPSSDLFVKLKPGQQPKVENLNPQIAAGFLQSNAIFEPEFEVMRQTLERPSARIQNAYSEPGKVPVVSIRGWFAVARTMSTRARCHLLLNQPGAALDDIALFDDTCRGLLEAQKPVTMLAAWIDLQGRGGCANLIAEGIQSNSWSESQLIALEGRLKPGNVLLAMNQALGLEREAVCWRPEPPTLEQLAGRNYYIDNDHIRQGDWNAFVAGASPRGWAYLGAAAIVDIDTKVIDATQADERIVNLKPLKHALGRFARLSAHWAPKSYLRRFSFDLDQICQTAVYVQTEINETRVACALERYLLAQGSYPATLDDLVPRFIDRIPGDVIDGGPLHYRCSATNRFCLYSIGWKGRDDGGAPGSKGYPYTKGDWVWPANL